MKKGFSWKTFWANRAAQADIQEFLYIGPDAKRLRLEETKAFAVVADVKMGPLMVTPSGIKHRRKRRG